MPPIVPFDPVAPSPHSSLPQQQERRVQIGLRAEAILSAFWRDDVPDVIRVIELESWMDVLEACTLEEIRMAWAEYQRRGPRTAQGRLLRPDAGALWRIVQDARPRPVLAAKREDPEPQRQRVTREAAAAIMASAGFGPRRFGPSEDGRSGDADGGAR